MNKSQKALKKEYDTILQLINEETRKGRFFTKTQFCYFFEDRFGLKGHHSIRKHINVLATEGYITFHEKETPGNNRCIKVMEAA
jgi:SOS-response transcriptional repressor LexA